MPAERLIVGDLAERDRLDQVLRRAAHRGRRALRRLRLVGESVHEPAKYYQNNLVNTLNLLDALRRHGIGRFVFSSTCATYGMPDVVPITEDEPQKPINPYGNTKLAIERALADYADRLRLGLRRPALLQRGRAPARTARIGEDHDPETHLIPLIVLQPRWANARPSRSSAPTIRRRTAPASATTSTSTTWPRPICWPWKRWPREGSSISTSAPAAATASAR